MKTILLTGGSGFIGRNILNSYLIEKYKIIAPSHDSLDLLDESSVESYFNDNQIDIVLHAAVKPGHRAATDKDNLFYSNTRMFFNLERMKSKYQKMIVLGSGAIYDMRHYHPKVLETDYGRFIPSDEHGFCKYVCEKVIEKSDNIYDLRIFGIFGKYEDYSIRFISNMICKALFGLPLSMYQDRKFDYLYIDDLMPILEMFIENEVSSKSYNITPDESISLKELAEMIVHISGKKLEIQISESGFGSEYSGNNGLLKSEFPNVCFTPIEKSVKTLYSWYENNRSMINKSKLLKNK